MPNGERPRRYVYFKIGGLTCEEDALHFLERWR